MYSCGKVKSLWGLTSTKKNMKDLLIIVGACIFVVYRMLLKIVVFEHQVFNISSMIRQSRGHSVFLAFL